MKTTTLSLCLLARNEAGNIGRCINSVKEFVDEIILVDTGSTDNTVEIALAMGAKVIEEKWKNDFSSARNISLENATGDWIFFLDCDEELAPESGKELRKVIQDSPYEAYFVLITNKTETGSELIFPSIRLFKNRKCFRFTGKIHEQIINSILDNYRQQSIGQTNISIIHHGYNASTTNIRAKIQRNLEILNSYSDEEKDGFFFYNLGTEYLRLGKRKKALGYYLEALKLTKPTQSYGPILVKRTMTALMELSRYRDAIEQLRYYQTIYKEFNDLVFLEGICHLSCGRYSAARSCLRQYLEMPPSPIWYPTETVFQGVPANNFLDRVNMLSICQGHPEISVCIIGRDESDLIGYCIQSVNEIAREVIYVDTGSVDRTPAIAYQLGANIYSFPWNNSFSEARNFAIDKASGEWILVLDADEALPEQSRERIVELIKDADQEGYVLKVCTFFDRALPSINYHLTGMCRLYRKKNYRYRGIVYEDVVPSILESGNNIAYADITINHFHYLAEDKHIGRKRQLKIDTIKRRLASDPSKLNYALGVEYFYAQDFATAVKYFENSFDNLSGANVPDFFYFYTLSLINTRNYGRAVKILSKAINLFPDYTDLIYLQAIARFMRGEIEEAELLLRRCLEMGDASWEKYISSPGTGSFKAILSLGTIYARKNTGKALELFMEAAGIPGVCEQAIESIVFLQDKLPVSLNSFLEDKGILNPHSLSVVSKSLAKMGRYKDSLKYLSLTSELVAKEPAPRNFTNITQAIDLLLEKFYWQAINFLPENSSFRCLMQIFKPKLKKWHENERS